MYFTSRTSITSSLTSFASITSIDIYYILHHKLIAEFGFIFQAQTQRCFLNLEKDGTIKTVIKVLRLPLSKKDDDLFYLKRSWIMVPWTMELSWMTTMTTNTKPFFEFTCPSKLSNRANTYF